MAAISCDNFEGMPTKKLFIEFIEILKQEVAIWQCKNDKYRNRKEKEKAWNRLLTKYKDADSTATMEMVRRRYNGIRSCYRRELQKLRGRPGYVPTLWYFDKLNFLRDQEPQQQEITSMFNDQGFLHDLKPQQQQQQDTSTINNFSSFHYQEPPQQQKEIAIDTSTFNNFSSFHYQEPPLQQKEIAIDNSFEQQTEKVTAPIIKRKKAVDPDELLELAAKRLKRIDDYSQTVANVWASEFRLVSDQQKFFAKKAIDDILFEARLGTLHRNSVKINCEPETYNASDATLQSPNRCMQNQYQIVHLPHDSQRSCDTTDSHTSSLKCENYSQSYPDVNEIVP